MDNLLKDYDNVKVFYDNFILFGKRKDHLKLFKAVLEKFAEYGMHINYKKCQFMVTECNFLGHVVNTRELFREWAHIVID